MQVTIVPSEFTKSVFTETAKRNNLPITTNIQVVPEYFDETQYNNKSVTTAVAGLDDIKESDAFLSVGHWLQGDFGEDRKNVGYTIKAFLEVFKNKKNQPALILKVSQGATSILDRDKILKRIDDVRKTVSSKNLPNIYVIHGDLSDSEINSIYNHPKVKAMVNLTKGEGFGRPLLEFSVVGKPIIASGWSGHIDFLPSEFAGLVGGTLNNIHPSAHVPNVLLRESQWFKPDDNQVGHAFMDVFEKYKNYQEKAKRLAFRNKQNFSLDKMTEALNELLIKYTPAFPKQVELKLPKLTKIK
jgi:glycosyltransferase involved in cell wall biosynthesis